MTASNHASGSLVGERNPAALLSAIATLSGKWSLLIVAELVFGGRRFSELRNALPTISANILSARLHSLMAEGVVVHVPGASAQSGFYRLTDAGMAIEPILRELARWGFRHGRIGSSIAVSPEQTMLALVATTASSTLPDSAWSVLFNIDRQPFAVTKHGNVIHAERGWRDRPNARVIGSKASLLDVLATG